jgi:hypothetical protein
MFDQTSILTEDKESYFEIRNGIRLLNEERTAVNTNTQEEWMRQQEAIINKKNTPCGRPWCSSPVQSNARKSQDNIRKDMARAQSEISILRSDLLKISSMTRSGVC